MDTRDPSIPFWKIALHLGWQVLLILAMLLQIFTGHVDRATFFAVLIVALEIEDKLDEHFGDLRRQDRVRARASMWSIR